VNYPSLSIDSNNNLLLYVCVTYIEDYRSEGSTNIISDYFYSLIVSINPTTVSINFEKQLESNSCIGHIEADLVNGNFAVERSVYSDPGSHSVHLFDSSGNQIFESSGILGIISKQSTISFKQDGSTSYVSYIFNDSGDALYDEYLIDGVIATASSSVIIHKFDISGNKSIYNISSADNIILDPKETITIGDDLYILNQIDWYDTDSLSTSYGTTVAGSRVTDWVDITLTKFYVTPEIYDLLSLQTFGGSLEDKIDVINLAVAGNATDISNNSSSIDSLNTLVSGKQDKIITTTALSLASVDASGLATCGSLTIAGQDIQTYVDNASGSGLTKSDINGKQDKLTLTSSVSIETLNVKEFDGSLTTPPVVPGQITCDSLLVDNVDIDTKISSAIKSSFTGFNATTSTATTSSGFIDFKNVLFDIGSLYSFAASRATIIVPGVYFFSFSFYSNNGAAFTVDLLQNGNMVNRIEQESDSTGINRKYMMTTIQNLVVDDQIYPWVTSFSIYLAPNETNFYGYLLSAT